ncbi:MAG: hypothetical protein GWN56_08125, partial [Nitrosopumilaceae archaeon]|nr:hypothetical protein [Nitrosopumilaceae archaeon]
IGEGDILYASTVASKFFFDNGGNSNNTFIFNGGLFNNQSTASGCRITNAQNQDIRCWKINLPNLPDCGIRFETQNCFIRDTNFVGGGSSCYGAIYQLDGR